MNMKRCENGHFYDADQFASCPHCQEMNAQSGNETVGIMGSTEGNKTVPAGRMEDSMPLVSSMASPNAFGGMGIIGDRIEPVDVGITLGGDPTIPPYDDDDMKTQSFYATEKGHEPVVGWLVCIKGEAFGEGFKLKSGRNFIGRASNMDVVLTGDATVSREKHAIVLYEPKRRKFMVQAGESRELFYLNDEVVLTAEELKAKDVLTIGKTKLLFVPCCDESFGWDELEEE